MYTISCESTVDLDLRYLNKRNISTIAHSYVLDGINYPDDMRNGASLAVLYNQIASGKSPRSLPISVEHYTEYFRPLLQVGDLLHLTLASALSESVVNALNAAEQLQKEFPDRKIYIVDTTCASVGYGMLVDCLADLRDEGKTLDEVHDWVILNRTRVHQIFYSVSPRYLKRHADVSCLKGRHLHRHSCLVMSTDSNGNILPMRKHRKETRAADSLLQDIGDNVGGDYSGKLWLGHSDYISSAHAMATRLRKLYPNADIRTLDIDPVIASRCGPGTVLACYWGNERAVAK